MTKTPVQPLDGLRRAALAITTQYSAARVESCARDLYTKCACVAPSWDQLGATTKSVWHDRATLSLSGHPRWWSINPDATPIIFQAASSPGIRATFQEYMNMSINSKQVAEQLDAISEAFTALASTFRHGSSAADDNSVDAAPTKPVRGSKPTTKPAAKSKQAEAESDLTIDDVRSKLKELVEAKGKDKMVEALESVGAGKLGDVDESQYQELSDKAQEFIDEDDEPAPKKSAAKGKKAGPSLDDVNAAAKELIAADKPAYLKLAKKLGKPSEMDEDDYAAAIAAYEDAMKEDGDSDDDLL